MGWYECYKAINKHGGWAQVPVAVRDEMNEAEADWQIADRKWHTMTGGGKRIRFPRSDTVRGHKATIANAMLYVNWPEWMLRMESLLLENHPPDVIFELRKELKRVRRGLNIIRSQTYDPLDRDIDGTIRRIAGLIDTSRRNKDKSREIKLQIVNSVFHVCSHLGSYFDRTFPVNVELENTVFRIMDLVSRDMLGFDEDDCWALKDEFVYGYSDGSTTTIGTTASTKHGMINHYWQMLGIQKKEIAKEGIANPDIWDKAFLATKRKKRKGEL